MMKFVTFCILLIFSTTLYAQKVQLGATVGNNYSFFQKSLPVSNDNGSIMGFNAGVIGQIHLKNQFYIFSEIGYEYGSIRSSHFYYQNTETDEVISFVVATIPIKFHFGKHKKFYLYSGPYFSYTIKMTRKLQFRATGEEQTFDQTDLFQRSELGLLAGLGYQLKLNEILDLILETNYSESLFYFGEYEKESTKHSIIRVKVGVLFTIK